MVIENDNIIFRCKLASPKQPLYTKNEFKNNKFLNLNEQRSCQVSNSR